MVIKFWFIIIDPYKYYLNKNICKEIPNKCSKTFVFMSIKLTMKKIKVIKAEEMLEELSNLRLHQLLHLKVKVD